jgi:hypothetical protein
MSRTGPSCHETIFLDIRKLTNVTKQINEQHLSLAVSQCCRALGPHESISMVAQEMTEQIQPIDNPLLVRKIAVDQALT